MEIHRLYSVGLPSLEEDAHILLRRVKSEAFLPSSSAKRQ